MRRPFQERRYSRGDKLQRPVPAVNAQAFSKFKAALKNRTKSGTRRAPMRFPVAPRVSPIPPNARSLQSKNRVRPRTRFFNLQDGGMSPLHLSTERSAALFVLMTMSERATTKLIGLSISGLFLMMLMLNAISS